MRKLRDVFYVYNYPESNYAIYYGMEFREFINCEPNNIKNILLLNTKFINWFNYDINSNTRLVYIDQNSMNKFLSENHYDFGDFGWLDFKENEKLNNLNSNEVAELLYLGHKEEPVSSPFFDILDNRYVYLAHDDGWYCKLYYKTKGDFKEIVANKIVQTISAKFKRKKFNPMPEDVKLQLYNLCNKGFVVNFSNALSYNRDFQLTFYTIGEFLNMDDMYNYLDKHINTTKDHWLLIYKNKEWKIEKGK